MGINRKLVDRSNVFYWQTDRDVTPEEAGEIWADRHRYFKDSELKDVVDSAITNDELVELSPRGEDRETDQNNWGNVNSVRIGKLASGREVAIRNHPRGVENGYFHVESLAAEKVKASGLPGYETIAIHDIEDENDHSFQVIEKLPGTVVQNWLNVHKEDEEKLLIDIGRNLAKLNQIPVEGFGPFDNKLAKEGKLVGVHKTFRDAQLAGLEFNLNVLNKEKIFSDDQVEKIKELFTKSKLLECDSPVLIHNDFADWNLLTDGNKITGIIDFDECVGGDFVSDIACWSTFFDSDRLPKMLKGYWQEREKPADFEERFQILRFRYTISKMTLRIRRYNWDPSESMKAKIEIGTKHLKDSLDYFKI